MNIVIMGNSGAGKSTTINCILEPLTSNMTSVGAEVGNAEGSCTKECKTFQGYIHDKRVNLVDTPGFNDTHGMSDAHILTMVMEHVATKTESKFIDAFILLEDCRNTKMEIAKNLGTLTTIFGPEAAAKTKLIVTKTGNALAPSAREDDQDEMEKRLEKIKTEA